MMQNTMPHLAATSDYDAKFMKNKLNLAWGGGLEQYFFLILAEWVLVMA